MTFWTKEEVAKYLRVNSRTVERWLHSGYLEGYKLGDGRTALWRISDTEVKRFLKNYKNTKVKKKK